MFKMKGIENEVLESFHLCIFFVGLIVLGLWGKNMFLFLFLKAYFFNIHVRHFIFGKYIGYIVGNKPDDHFLKFLILSF